MSGAVEGVALLPCPFCGGEAYMTEGHRDHWRVECRQCAAKRHLHYVGDDGQERAIAAWNTRALSPQTLPAPGEVEQSDWEFAYSFTRKGHMKGSDGITVLANLVSEYRRTFLKVGAPSEQANGVGITGPCANCGNEGSSVKGADKLHPYRVICKSCGASTAHHASWRASNDAWNRRPTPATVAAENDEGVALDWRAVAKLAGEHGVRYRTNTALEKFLAAIRLLPQGGGK